MYPFAYSTLNGQALISNALCGNLHMVCYLLQAGANVNARHDCGVTALYDCESSLAI
jgi:ankyrin repeat protein